MLFEIKLCQELKGSHSWRINSIKGKLLTIGARCEHRFYDVFFLSLLENSEQNSLQILYFILYPII